MPEQSAGQGLLVAPTMALMDDDYSVSVGERAELDVFGNDRGWPIERNVRLVSIPDCATVDVDIVSFKLVVVAGESCPETIEVIYGAPVLTDATAKVTITVTRAEPPEPEPIPEPPEPDRIAREDSAEVDAGESVQIAVLDNDSFGGVTPSLSIDRQPSCGEARVDGGNVIYQADPDCAGDIDMSYRFDTGESAPIRVRVAPAAACPMIDGIDFVHVPARTFSVARLRGAVGVVGHLARKMAIYTTLPESEMLEEFCIGTRQLAIGSGDDDLRQDEEGNASCPMRNWDDRYSVGYMFEDARTQAERLAPSKHWQMSIPTAVDLLAALEYALDAGPGAQSPGPADIEKSIRHGPYEWLDTECGENLRMVVGTECDKTVAMQCFGLEQVRNDFGLRVVARRHTGD